MAGKATSEWLIRAGFSEVMPFLLENKLWKWAEYAKVYGRSSAGKNNNEIEEAHACVTGSVWRVERRPGGQEQRRVSRIGNQKLAEPSRLCLDRKFVSHHKNNGKLLKDFKQECVLGSDLF